MVNKILIACAMLGLTIALGCTNHQQNPPAMRPQAKVQFLSPEGMHKNPAYSQAVVTSGPVKTIYIGGQNPVDASGNLVGKGDFKAQVEQTLKNVKLALEAAGAKPEHLIKWNIYVVQGQSFQDGFEVFQRVWGKTPNAPLTTGMYVSGLTNPDYLIEIEAIAVVPEE